MKRESLTVEFTLNGTAVSAAVDPGCRLSEVLREDLGLKGTKVGCEAGDCGACTVLLDGEQVCACMVPAGQVVGRDVTTVEGLAAKGGLNSLQQAFHRHGAAQCGICTPGMLMAAIDLLRRNAKPNRRAVMDALGGVLCRCTGYRKIVEAVLDAAKAQAPPVDPPAGAAVGARLAKVDGEAKLTGVEAFGDDVAPRDALLLRVVRAPHARARFTIGALDRLYAGHPGLLRVLTADDVPGNNGFGIYPHIKDQPVLAEDRVRYRGEAVLALVGEAAAIRAIPEEEIPIVWRPQEAVAGIEAALAPDAPAVQEDKPDNVLTRGRLVKGDVDAGFAAADHVVEGAWQTGFVEHAYIEPEAGFARRVDDRIEVTVTTQAPYMDRDETAQVLGLAPEQVRIVPSACGGGFGGKLDLSVQPLLALAAWLTGRPVRCAYTRPESMASSTKRHPARITARAGCTEDGEITAFRFHGDFNTGAYASWGPTVADRVPVHCTGPYFVPNVSASSAAVLTNEPPAGAFRGFGVPQAAIAHEALMDMMAEQAGIDPLAFRIKNALAAGLETATGQRLEASVGLVDCLQKVQPYWEDWRTAAVMRNAVKKTLKRGVGLGCMWYGCGNTSISNPSTMTVGVSRDGRVTLYNGAVDIGQGANTVMVQICADSLGVPAAQFGYVMGDTDRTADAGKSSASRQTFVSGKAAELAGADLRAQILRQTNAGPEAKITIGKRRIMVREGAARHEIDLAALPEIEAGDVLRGSGTFDPPTTKLDENGQGAPYGTYGFAAQIAEVEVDIDLGTVKVRRMVAAHDVGRAINPVQVEGQIHGGIAQGLGLALMEEYLPGRTENLHDYLIPTVGDMPEIEVIIVEDPEPLGPYGAKGIGEPALIPTAPAILGAIHQATGLRMTRLPVMPDRLRAAILAREKDGGND
ncbi:MAG: molybdopterin-dependent oxidoreductase [Rhodospirillales bacterium]|nr:molybdopterin-dependent oxidoreductase [Rhodospirillales bacterium]MDH3912633.1 molybdopterin-dependent oxidoreductase [Rhodospirillales bacterium]MDH3917116.1 molybdopterin-dependent oxidoreductase [Rhodospirillales bacterium]MDH3968335.1 molybdopterin-dependent oxidoreductase [Rhodospirillales bacterium]